MTIPPAPGVLPNTPGTLSMVLQPVTRPRVYIGL